MIIGRTQSADGGFRRIPIRHTQIVDNGTRNSLVTYLKEMVYQKCKTMDWVGASDLFPHIPEDIMNTPLKIIFDLCSEKFKDSPRTVNINISKYIGMLVREAVYYSEVKYYEQMMGSVRKYSYESKSLSSNDFEKNRRDLINSVLNKKN